MAKLLSIIISSKNNQIYLLKLMNQIINLENYYNFINLYVTNDGSTEDYSEVVKFVNKHPGIFYTSNKNSIGKVCSIINIAKKVNTPYICTMDDKDELLPSFDNSLSKLINSDKLYVGYLVNKNMQLIGDPIPNNTDFFSFYYRKALIGDHIYFYPLRIYKQFNVPKELSNLIINDELVINNLVFHEKLNLLSNEPLLIHDYSKGHLTNFIFQNKVKNWQVTRWCIKLIFGNKPSLKIKVAKLFELFLTRKKAKIKFSKFSNKLLYYFLYVTGSFIVIKQIYILLISRLMGSK